VSAGLPADAGGAKREPIDTLRRRLTLPSGDGSLKRVRGGRVRPRFKALAGVPWKGRSPREHPADRHAKHIPAREGLSEGLKPRSRGLPGRVAASAVAVPVGGTAGGFFRVETSGYLSRGEGSEG
jgi:hypothetical protein